MDRIKESYKEVKDLYSIAKIYRDSKRDVLELESGIEELKNIKKSLDLSSILSEISDLENSFQNVSKEIECINIIKDSCLSMEGLKTIFSAVKDSSICFQKCLDFSKNLFVTFNISNQKAKKIFSLDREENFFTILRISKELEELLCEVENKAFVNNVFNEIRSILLLDLEKIVPFDLSCFINEKFIFLVYPTEDHVECEDSSFPASNTEENTKEMLFGTCHQLLPKSFDLILSILKNNLLINLVKDQYTLEDVILNNEKLKNTPYYILDPQEWILDIVIKEIISLSKIGINSEELYNIDDCKSGKFISSNYHKLLKLYQILLVSKSTRYSKAMKAFNGCIIKFFAFDSYESLKDFFVLYSDISHFIKKYRQSEIFDQLNAIREEIFYKIMKKSSFIEINFDLQILMLKAKIKQKQFDFNEYLEMFIPEKTKEFFKLQFFEKLFDSFLKNAFKPKKINENEKNILKELSQYLMDISYAIDSNMIGNYVKISSLYKVLDSSLQTTIDLYESNELFFSKPELRNLIRMLHEKSNLRDVFIDQLM